jgi:DNA repair protein RecN (Recombination protein N)
MLLSLRIENFALIDALDLEFGPGLNVLTGETGAGKSIILDAIDAVLGGKVGGRAIRTGADRALIEAQFRLTDGLKIWCETAEIDLLDDVAPDQVLVCSREITATRNRSRINGVVVNKQQLESLRERLVEITAQGQTVQLGQPSRQRDWLDSFGGPDVLKLRETVSAAYNAYQQAIRHLEQRQKQDQQRLQQADIIAFQLKELTTAELGEPDELEQLSNEHQRLSHSVDLQQQSYEAYELLYQNDDGTACADLLGQAELLLTGMVAIDGSLQPVLEAIRDALAQVDLAGREINLYGDGLEADPDRFQAVQERVMALKQICRKYGPTLTDAIALQARLQADMNALTGEGESLEELEALARRRKSDLAATCATLTQARQQAATQLERLLIAQLKPLAMDKVQFQVGMTPIGPGAGGADRITYLFSPNPGEPLQPLIEVASGGEMSRFLLALQSCFSQVDAAGTLVFDEIDVGVSGRVAQAIAEKLHQLSCAHQVLCVTHQPIVAAMADHHFRVSKQVIGESTAKNGKTRDEDVRTVVRIAPLDDPQRRQELAQIASGDAEHPIGDGKAAFDFADSLLLKAATLRATQAEVGVKPAKAAKKPLKAK